MAAIGEIITAAQLKDLQAWSRAPITQTLFVNPTIYRFANIGISGFNYYSSVRDVIFQYAYLQKIKNFTKAVKPAGVVLFKTPKVAEQMGVSCDFFLYHPTLGIIPAPYAVVKKMYYSGGKPANFIVRFYKKDGTGPFFAIANNTYLGIAATKIENVPNDKVNAIVALHNTVQKLKNEYNTLAEFVAALSKRKLNATEQQIFNESVLRLNSFQKQLERIKGIDIVWDNNGTVSGNARIGLDPITITIIVIIAIAAVAGTWLASKIIAVTSDLIKLYQANNMIKFVHDQKLKIAQSNLPQKEKDKLNEDLDKTKEAAQNNANNITNKKDEGFIDKIGKYALMFGGIYFGAQLLKRSNNG